MGRRGLAGTKLPLWARYPTLIGPVGPAVPAQGDTVKCGEPFALSERNTKFRKRIRPDQKLLKLLIGAFACTCMACLRPNHLPSLNCKFATSSVHPPVLFVQPDQTYRVPTVSTNQQPSSPGEPRKDRDTGPKMAVKASAAGTHQMMHPLELFAPSLPSALSGFLWSARPCRCRLTMSVKARRRLRQPFRPPAPAPTPTPTLVMSTTAPQPAGTRRRSEVPASCRSLQSPPWSST